MKLNSKINNKMACDKVDERIFNLLKGQLWGKTARSRKRKKLLIALIPLTVIGVTLGITLPIPSKSHNVDPCDYVANMDGTDWKGYESGVLNCTPNPDGKTVTINNAGGYTAKDLVIPNTVVDENKITYIVTSIGDSAFAFNDLTGGLTISSYITSILRFAFTGCSSLVGSLTIPNSVASIGTWAFRNCSGFNDELVIGNNVDLIDLYAFENCNRFNRIIGNFSSQPDIRADAFEGWKNSGSPTVHNNISSYTSRQLRDFLVTSGPRLPNIWTAN